MLRTVKLYNLAARNVSQHSPATVSSQLRVTTVDQKSNGARVSLVVNTGLFFTLNLFKYILIRANIYLYFHN